LVDEHHVVWSELPLKVSQPD